MFEKEAEEYGIENYESCMYDDVKGWETDRKAREQGFKDGAQMVYDTVKSIVDGVCKDEEQRLKDVESQLLAQLDYLATWSKNGRA